MGKIIGLDALQSAVQGKLEPIHEINTVTGTNGTITLTNMLKAPVVEFSATGMGTPTIVSVPEISASEQGLQDWDTPLILDVPLGILPTQNGLYYGFMNPVLLNYGGGVGSNTYMPISGKEEGTTVYLTSKELASYFRTMDNNENARITYEGDVGDKGCYTFACPLPFSVAENPVVCCSHLKNQNVALTEGIWASGNMLYIRAYSNHLNNEWEKMANDIERIGKNCVYYSPFGNFSDPSFCDFFIMLTTNSSFTKDGDSATCSIESGAQSLAWLKISDYLTLYGGIDRDESEEEEEEEEGDPITLTPLTSVSVTYYLDTAINRQSRNFSSLLTEKRMQIPQLGYAASADEGGAVGYSASAENGGAVGNGAKTRDGGAVGSHSIAENGGAVGDETKTINGGAVGVKAQSEGGGSVGEGAKTTDGAAIGKYARCYANGEPIDAIQLGTGTNETAGTMQVYSYQMMDSNGNIPLARLSEAEPAHKTQTITTTGGTISITNALDAPLIEFSATGMEVPSVTGSVVMGDQTWNNPMVLDVPIGVVDANNDAVFLDYGGGIGRNTYVPTEGKETGRVIYYNSRQLAKLFDYAEDNGGTVTVDGYTSDDTYELFTIPLPFSVATGSPVYCSHLKNQNVSGEEGIWADGSTLYIRALKKHASSHLDGFADKLEAISWNCNFYNPYNPVGFDTINFSDFFIMLTASEDYTKKTDRVVIKPVNGYYYYFKISDYIAVVSESAPNPTPMTDISITYYLDTTINKTQNSNINMLINSRFKGVAALGKDALAEHGGAVGEGAVENYGGGAVGYQAKASTGGAVGVQADTNGGQGGAVGAAAKAFDGGAVGYGAKTSDGAAVGRYAVCKNTNDEPINAVQLGSGINQTPYTMQVYSTTLLRPRFEGSQSGVLVIPLSLITDSCNAATVSEQNDFVMNLDILLGNIVRYTITDDLIGSPVGTFVKLISNNTVSEAIDNGDVFIGQLAAVPTSNYALVRVKGIMETEASLNLGLQRVAFSDGALDVSANGREIFVTSSDNGKITFIV